MKRSKISGQLAVCVAVACVAGCGTWPRQDDAGTSTDADVGRPADQRYVRTTRYEHEIKTDQGPQRQVVEYGWDYDQAAVVERTFDMDGQPLAQRTVPGQILRATEQEQEWAFDLVRHHPDLRPSVTAEDVHLYGGFILMEPDDPHCHLRSRCVYVFASLGDGSRKVAQAIVDLQTNQVVYPHYEPETTRPLK